MIYLSEMLRDCSKSRPTSFSDLSFPIIHQIQSKIRNKNVMLRRKLKQKLSEKQKYGKTDEKKQQVSIKKQNSIVGKADKQQLNYLEAYQQQKNISTVNINNYGINLDAVLDEKEEQVNINIYLLMKKKKNIFKVQEIKRKIKSRESKRINLKECQCCLRVGKHKCTHLYCQKKCQKYMNKALAKDLIQNPPFQRAQALNIAEEVIEESLKEKVKTIQMVRISPEIKEEVKIPQIDVQGDHLAIDKAIISQNESKSNINGQRSDEDNIQQIKDSQNEEQFQDKMNINAYKPMKMQITRQKQILLDLQRQNYAQMNDFYDENQFQSIDKNKSKQNYRLQ